MKGSYYNEIDPFAAAWLRNLIAANLIPAGEVDERSIVDVSPDDLRRFRQCHFFAGIGGWALAARLAGWPDDREIWTGSAPCQPFSVAGQGKAQADDRHLWPHLFRLASARRPAVLMGEQVAAAVGKDWLDGVFADLESIGYACGAVVVPACAVDAPHRRDRLWFVADANGLAGGQGDPNAGRRQDGSRSREAARLECSGDGALAHADQLGASARREQRSGQLGGTGGDSGACAGNVADTSFRADQRSEPWAGERTVASRDGAGHWSDHGWIFGHDGKARRVGTRVRRVADGLPAGMAGLCAGRDAAQGEVEMIPLLAHGVPARVGKLRAFGNAIVPQVAAEVIGAFMDARP